MLNKTLHKGLNDQVNMELTSAYIYLELSIRATAMKMPGVAHWMRTQSVEEMQHAARFMKFLRDADAAIALTPVSLPKLATKAVRDLFAASLKQEQEVTASITALAETALKNREYAAFAFLQEFCTEQLEEELQVKDILDRLDIMGCELLTLDKELGARSCECKEFCYCED